ncbi:MAG: hypothetical protein CME62_01450 [Halobacteriovoraceae bacterium]|nr:hypothetical protein [Halobacteriovoraceae bacterium]|tara:strand:- start:12524 stop:12769 length:246 start_codon:yes stop_codon:yes gene_type:complete
MDKSLLEELKTLRDEIKVQSHLLGMELKDEWESVEKTFSKYESQLEDVLADFGKFNEDFWVGNKEEVDQMIATYSALKNKM